MGLPQSFGNRILICLLVGIICFPVLLSLVPNIEASRQEVRIAQAYNDVQRIAAAWKPGSQPSAAAADGDSDAALEADPWGQPYRIVETDRSVLVVSSGLNMKSPSDGTDEDDIHSDMPQSPIVAIHAAKRRQFQIALAVPAAWLVFTAVYLFAGWHAAR